MTILLYLIGIIIGVTFFLYMLSLFRSGKNTLMKITGKNPEGKVIVEPQRIINAPQTPRAPGSRICPLCGSTLTKFEALYASHILDDSGKKILIHGCRYCYKPDEDPEKTKKSVL